MLFELFPQQDSRQNEDSHHVTVQSSLNDPTCEALGQIQIFPNKPIKGRESHIPQTYQIHGRLDSELKRLPFNHQNEPVPTPHSKKDPVTELLPKARALGPGRGYHHVTPEMGQNVLRQK